MTHGDEHPVFVTRDGRPRRRPRWIARGLAAAMVAWLAAVVIGATGFFGLPALPAAGTFVAQRHVPGVVRVVAPHALHPPRVKT